MFSIAVTISRRGYELSTVHDIERAIDALTPQQLLELYSWLDRNHPQPIDACLTHDLAEGQLDSAILRALSDENTSRTRSL